MPKKGVEILSARKWNTNASLQVVYEWEDIIAEVNKLGLNTEKQYTFQQKTNNKISQLFQKIIRRSFLKNWIDSSYNFFSSNNETFLSFYLYPLPINNHYFHQKNFIIILLDCFENVIDKVPEYFKRNKLVFVTNLEVYNRLQETSLSKKISYIPLSISDKYFTETAPQKTFDVIQMGRQNKVLHEWMLAVSQKYPYIEYIYLDKKDNQSKYFSTTKGWLVEQPDTRQQFMDFLGKAKVSLLSAPGIDGGEERTGGFNPVTPRFYESAVNYCYMIGRFPDAEDFIYNNVATVCERPADYEAFEETVLKMLSTPFNQFESYKPFIQQHLSSNIAGMIKKEIDSLN